MNTPRLQKKFEKNCPPELLNKSFIVAHFGLITIKGACDDGFMCFSEQNDLFTFKKEHVYEYLKDPKAVHKLIK